MKTFDFIITVNFFHDVERKSAHLFNYTFNEAYSVFTDLKLKYANDNHPFKELVMQCRFKDEVNPELDDFRVVSYLFHGFFDFDDDEQAL